MDSLETDNSWTDCESDDSHTQNKTFRSDSTIKNKFNPKVKNRKGKLRRLTNFLATLQSNRLSDKNETNSTTEKNNSATEKNNSATEKNNSAEYLCEQCESVFMSFDLLESHKVTSHIKKQKIQCDSCKETFSSKIDLENHSLSICISNVRGTSDSSSNRNGDLSTLKSSNSTSQIDSNVDYLEPLSVDVSLPANEVPSVIKKPKRKEKSAANLLNDLSSIALEVPRENEEGAEQTIVYTCEKCTKVFKTSRGLNVHISRIHGKVEKVNIQEKSELEQSVGKAMMEPEVKIEILKTFHCYLCNKVFVQKEILMKHISQFHKVSVLNRCKDCLEYFHTSGDFCLSICSSEKQCGKKSEVIMEAEKKQHCSMKEPEKKVQRSLKTHKDKPASVKIVFKKRPKITKPSVGQKHAQVSNKTSLKCTKCNKQLSGQRELSEHMNVHTGMTPFSCLHCTRAFSNHSNLTTHVRKHHLKIVNYRCTHCDKGFLKNTELQSHVSSKHTPKPIEKRTIYNCNECAHTFTSNRLLRSHMMQIHVYRKLYQCQNCRKHLPSEDIFNKHESECGKTQSDKLTRIHTKEKNFVCTVCKKSFRMKKYLKIHSYTHIMEGQFACKHCEKSYKHPSGLCKHVRKVHPTIGEFCCTECDRSFETNRALTLHVVSQHPKDF